jgi:hypothetical protein
MSKKDRDADVASFATMVNRRDNILQAAKDEDVESYRHGHRTPAAEKKEEEADAD